MSFIGFFIKSFALLLIKFYKIFLSPITMCLGFKCRFYPTCSEYAKQAFTELKPIDAIRATILRLMRCGPWHPGGVDKLETYVSKMKGNI